MIFQRLCLLAIFAVGFYGIAVRRNLIKKVFGLSIVTSAVVLLFIVEGSRAGREAPIMVEGAADIVDPLPQALMLTAIVISVCVTALALALVRRIHQARGSLDIQTPDREDGDEG